MHMTSGDYMKYLSRVAKVLTENKDYVTELDAATGDGDHWANMNMGFTKIMEMSDELAAMPVGDMFKKIAMTMMSVIGGSSGILYASAYLKASAVAGNVAAVDLPLLVNIIEAELEGVMTRGNAEPGFKTMVDPLYQAACAMRKAFDQGQDERAVLVAMKEGAIAGMEATAQMEAMRGRACYQPDKGVGHLDPGAVTMCYQLTELADALME